MAKRFTAFLEYLVIAALLLVLVENFLEDFSVLAGWPVPLRQGIQLAGFAFDLFFTIEFFARLYYSILERRVGRYLGREQGWVDFLASIPILIFSSGPFVAALMIAGLLNLVKIVKAMRIARILRLLRFVKLLRHARRRVSLATTIAVSVLAFGLLSFSLLAGIPGLRGIEASLAERQEAVATYAERAGARGASLARALEALWEASPELLVLRYRGETLLSRYDDGFYDARFAPGEYGYLARGELECFFDRRALGRQLAGESLLFFALAAAIVLAFLFTAADRPPQPEP